MWSNDYLQSLRETHTANMKPVKGQVNRVPRIGEVVILKEELIPRGRWKLARIESLVEGSVDGVHRAAVVMTSSGKRLKRPYRMIYPLEAGDVHNQAPSNDDVMAQIQPDTQSTGSDVRRGTRAAAQIARKRISTNLRASESDESDV